MFWCIGLYDEAQQITITTRPFLPYNVGATNYVNLQLVSSITGAPIACNWRYDGRTLIFYETGNCSRDVSNTDYSSFCEEDENSISFIYTIRTPLRNEINYGINCIFPVSASTIINIQVQGTMQLPGV